MNNKLTFDDIMPFLVLGFGFILCICSFFFTLAMRAL